MKLEDRLNRYLRRKGYTLIEKIAKGHASFVYKIKDKTDRVYALKVERDDSPRNFMIQKEGNCLQMANSVGVGPRLYDTDFENRIILMEYIDGLTFYEYLFSDGLKKEDLEDFLRRLFKQAKRLDNAGLDHSQLGGRGVNILVRDNYPVIIDFEKASYTRGVHNVNQLRSFLIDNPTSVFPKRVRTVLGYEYAPNLLE